MKTKQHTFRGILTVLLAPLMFLACNDNDNQVINNKINITNIYMTGTTTIVTSAYRGDTISIGGMGFSTTKNVYINGEEVEFTSIKSSDVLITIAIPADLPAGNEVEDEDILNTIRIVTDWDDQTFNFEIGIREGDERILTISNIYQYGKEDPITTAIRGERITLIGEGFPTTQQIYVNGTEVTDDIEIAYYSLSFTIPTNTPVGNEVQTADNLNKIRIITRYDDKIVNLEIQEEPKIEVEAIYMYGTQDPASGMAMRGETISIIGSGLAYTTEITCNGYAVTLYENQVTETMISFMIPNEMPSSSEVNEEDRDKIRIISPFDEYTATFTFTEGGYPSFTTVSHTFPNVGDIITIEGHYLDYTTAIYFPASGSEIEGRIISVSENEVKVEVPTGVGNESGHLHIVSRGKNIYSPGYMFYKQGIFLQTFNETIMASGGDYARYSGNDVATATGLQSNPEHIAAIPKAPVNIGTGNGADTNSGFLKFYTVRGLQQVIDNSNGEITTNTPLENIAIQFDLYMNQPWISGSIPFRLNKDGGNKENHQYTYNIMPWTVDQPYEFNGQWKTITVYFSDFVGLTVTTLGEYMALVQNYESLLGFYNYNYGGNHPVSALTQFQMFIARLRVVPLTTPEN